MAPAARWMILFGLVLGAAHAQEAAFTLTLADDAVYETTETAAATLASVDYGGIGPPSTYTLTILDNDDPPAPAALPIGPAAALVLAATLGALACAKAARFASKERN